jgi:hypothetical protein
LAIASLPTVVCSAGALEPLAGVNFAIGSAYAASITTEGGTPPYRWTLGGGSLPPGIAIDPAKGLLLGTPTSAGTFNFFVLTTDAVGPNTSSEIRARVLAAQFTLVVK